MVSLRDIHTFFLAAAVGAILTLSVKVFAHPTAPLYTYDSKDDSVQICPTVKRSCDYHNGEYRCEDHCADPKHNSAYEVEGEAYGTGEAEPSDTLEDIIEYMEEKGE